MTKTGDPNARPINKGTRILRDQESNELPEPPVARGTYIVLAEDKPEAQK